jgi:hypothetical protein
MTSGKLTLLGKGSCISFTFRPASPGTVEKCARGLYGAFVTRFEACKKSIGCAAPQPPSPAASAHAFGARTARSNAAGRSRRHVKVDPHIGEAAELEESRRAAMQRKRDAGAWYGVTGIAMLFAGSFHVGFAVGGVFMVIGGAVVYLYWSRRLGQVEDPWDDADLDAWEQEHFHR